jgi:hypothetical protein
MRNDVGGRLHPGSTTGRSFEYAVFVFALLLAAACGRGGPAATATQEEPARLARTEFTERIENFFEHDPLAPGKPSAFLIHLTDLTDGSPVETAQVTLAVRPDGGGTPLRVTARVGRVTGIYIADVTVPSPGTYTIDFRVKSARLDEHMTLDGFDAR